MAVSFRAIHGRSRLWNDAQRLALIMAVICISGTAGFLVRAASDENTESTSAAVRAAALRITLHPIIAEYPIASAIENGETTPVVQLPLPIGSKKFDEIPSDTGQRVRTTRDASLGFMRGREMLSLPLFQLRVAAVGRILAVGDTALASITVEYVPTKALVEFPELGCSHPCQARSMSEILVLTRTGGVWR